MISITRFALISIFYLFSIPLLCGQLNDRWQVTSVNGNVKFSLYIKEKQLFYTVSLRQNEQFQEIIGHSPMGIQTSTIDFSKNLAYTGETDIRRIDYKQHVLMGKSQSINNLANEKVLSFVADGNPMDIVVRVYDDGMAFRYVFPNSYKKLTVTKETTGFKIPEGKAWIQPYDDVTKWTPGYEQFYENEIKVGTPSPKQNGWAFPALFHTKDSWVLLSEAGLNSDFYGAHLNGNCTNGLYTIRLPEKEEAMGLYENHATGERFPWSTPWRTAIIGEDLNTIVSSNLIKKLAEKSTLDDYSWVKPGRASWSWLSDADSPKNYQKLKKFVDLAYDMGWEYSLIDANWNKMEGGNLKKLTKYANSKGIGLLVWYNSGGPHNIVTEEVRDKMHITKKRRKTFKRLQKWGVKGIKVDFFQSDKPEIIKQYLDILKDAAEYEVLVNFHGCTIPRGWSNTYPNLMTMESVRGAESYTFAKNYPENAPSQNTILPVTRNVLGSMDYTPVIFTDMKYPHITTYAHELALAVLFESGIVHFGDTPESYKNLPQAPKVFLKEVPVKWDETRYISGWPGKEMIIARRKSNSWYISGVNGENKLKSMEFKLPFLSKNQHEAELISDGDSPKKFKDSKLILNRETNITVKVLPHGGFVLKIL